MGTSAHSVGGTVLRYFGTRPNWSHRESYKYFDTAHRSVETLRSVSTLRALRLSRLIAKLMYLTVSPLTWLVDSFNNVNLRVWAHDIYLRRVWFSTLRCSCLHVFDVIIQNILRNSPFTMSINTFQTILTTVFNDRYMKN